MSMIWVKTLTVQLIDAQPDRIRICRIDGESLVTVVVPREDLEFPTPSAAAVFVLGGSQNGWTEWVSDNGETLNQVYRSEEN